MTIRPVSVDDAQSIAEIYRPIVQETIISFELEAPDRAEIENRIRKKTERYPWLVLTDDKTLIGYAYAGEYRSRPAYQWSVEVSIYMHAERRGKGHGTQLYQALLDELRKRGFYNAYAGTALPDTGSVSFHQKMGFKPIGVYSKVGYKFGKWHDVAWWQLPLQDDDAEPASMW